MARTQREPGRGAKVAPEPSAQNTEQKRKRLEELGFFKDFSEAQKLFFEKHLAKDGPEGHAPTPARVVDCRIKQGRDMPRLKAGLGVALVVSLGAAALNLSLACSIAKANAVGCVIVALAAGLGLVGARRLPQDIAQDLDALETPAQHLLQTFFHMSWVAITCCVVPVSLLTLDDTELVCPAAPMAAAASAANLVLVPATAWGMYYCVRLVTLYEMVQSLQELCCLWTILLSMFIATGALMTSNRTAFLSASTDILGEQSVWIAGSQIWAIIMIPVSVFGFYAGWVEQRPLLKLHALAALAMGVVACVVFPLLLIGKTSETDILEDQCSQVLRLMGGDWFQAFFGCQKYLPVPGETTELRPPVCERFTGFKMSTGLQWEEGSCRLGCLDAQCCQEVERSLHVLESLLAWTGLMLVLVVAVSVWSSKHLHDHTTADERILHHRRSGKIAVAIAATVCCGIGAAAGISFGSTFSVRTAEERANMCDWPVTVVLWDDDAPISSCDNGIKDGLEVQVDCGDCAVSISAAGSSSDEDGGGGTEVEEGVFAPETTWRRNSRCDAPEDLDLKVRFAVDADADKICTVTGLEELQRCGGTTHGGDGAFALGVKSESIHVMELARTHYAFYVESRRGDRPLETAGVRLSVQISGVEQMAVGLPPVNATSYDMLGYDAEHGSLDAILATVQGTGARSTGYAFARLVCVDATLDGAPAIYACPQYFLDGLEDRVHACHANSTCKGCELPDETTFWHSENTETVVQTCQPPDAYMQFDEIAAPKPGPSGVSAGWFIDPVIQDDGSAPPRTCNQVCSTLNLTCIDDEMAAIETLEDCQSRLGEAMTRWCVAQDANYEFSNFYLPSIGGVYQYALRDGLADCVCKNGMLPGTEPGSQAEGIELEGPAYQVVPLESAWEDPGATCTVEGQEVVRTGQAVDTDTAASYVVEYACCSPGQVACSAKVERVVLVNDGAGRECSSWMAGDALVISDDTAYGGCVVDRTFEVFMNNAHKGYPDPERVYYASANLFVGACSERPTYPSDRRVCYCG